MFYDHIYAIVTVHSIKDCQLSTSTVCRANSFKRSISHVEFNKSHVVLRNDVQFPKSTSHLLKTTGTF